MIEKIMTFVKGAVIGGSMLVPGVSGGTMAMILNIYDDLISSINSITRFKFNKLPFLLTFGVGAVLGFVLLSSPITWLLTNYETPTLFFFIGAVVGGIPIMFREAKMKKIKFSTILYVIAGFAIVFLISKIPSDLLQVDLSAGWQGYAILFLAGIFISVALILPGISTSFMLLTLGIYEATTSALSNLYLPYLLPLGIGLIVGILLTTGILETAMKKFPTPTYLIIIGFVLASVLEAIPPFPPVGQLPICILLFLIAVVITNRLAAMD